VLALGRKAAFPNSAECGAPHSSETAYETLEADGVGCVASALGEKGSGLLEIRRSSKVRCGLHRSARRTSGRICEKQPQSVGFGAGVAPKPRRQRLTTPPETPDDLSGYPELSDELPHEPRTARRVKHEPQVPPPVTVRWGSLLSEQDGGLQAARGHQPGQPADNCPASRHRASPIGRRPARKGRARRKCLPFPARSATRSLTS